MSRRSLPRRLLIVVLMVLTLSAVRASTAHASLGPTTPCAQPPAQVDLTTLSNAQLVQYGLPKLPTNPIELARWTEELHHAVHHVCTTTPTNRRFSQENSANWAGYVGTGGSYDYAYAKWNVPCLGSSLKGSDSGAWIGLGGDPNDGGGYVVQAGTEQGFDTLGHYYYDAWIEDAPYNSEQVIDYNTSCGDLMSVYVSSDYDYAGQVYYSVFDETSGFYFAQPYSWPLSNGSTGDWIVERPGADLANFRSVTYTSCEAVRFDNSNPVYLGNLPYNSVVMWSSVSSSGQGQGNELAYPSGISSNTNFTVYWSHAS